MYVGCALSIKTLFWLAAQFWLLLATESIQHNSLCSPLARVFYFMFAHCCKLHSHEPLPVVENAQAIRFYEKFDIQILIPVRSNHLDMVVFFKGVFYFCCWKCSCPADMNVLVKEEKIATSCPKMRQLYN